MITMSLVKKVLSIFNDFEQTHLKQIGDFARQGGDFFDAKAKDAASIIRKELKKEIEVLFAGAIDEELEDYLATHIFGMVTGALVAASTYAYMV